MFIDLHVESSRMSPLHHGEPASYACWGQGVDSASELTRDIELWEVVGLILCTCCPCMILESGK